MPVDSEPRMRKPIDYLAFETETATASRSMQPDDGWANARIPVPSSPAFEALMANGKDWRKGGHWRTYFRASDFRRYLGFKKGVPPHPWLVGVPPVVIDEWLSRSYFDNLTKKFVFQGSELKHVGAFRALVAKVEAWW